MAIINPKYVDFSGQAMVTFSYDDGHNSNYQYALPLHEQYNIPGTFNIIGKRIVVGITGFFDAQTVKECDARNIEIASHGYTHEGTQLINQTDEEVHFECSESKRVLSELVTRIETIAIPYSGYDERVRGIVMQYYDAVRVYGSTHNTIPPEDRYWLKSHAQVNTWTFNDFKTRIDTVVANGYWLIFMMHRVGYENTLYEVTPELLEQVFQYINTIPRPQLLPVNTRDGIRFALGLGDYVSPVASIVLDPVTINMQPNSQTVLTAIAYDAEENEILFKRRWSITSGDAEIIDNLDGTATVTVGGSGNVVVRCADDYNVWTFAETTISVSALPSLSTPTITHENGIYTATVGAYNIPAHSAVTAYLRQGEGEHTAYEMSLVSGGYTDGVWAVELPIQPWSIWDIYCQVHKLKRYIPVSMTAEAM